MPEKKYTSAEACAYLGVADKTLLEWARALRIVPAREERDRRKHLYTQSQLDALAKEHGITPYQRMVTLEDALAAIADQERRLASLEQQVQRLLSGNPKPDTPPPIATLAMRPPAQERPSVQLAALPRGTLQKATAARLVSQRHGGVFNSMKGWPWPDAALVSEDTAIKWALEYVAGDYRRIGHGWRWHCSVPSCPCHQRNSAQG